MLWANISQIEITHCDAIIMDVFPSTNYTQRAANINPTEWLGLFHGLHRKMWANEGIKVINSNAV